MNLNLSAISFRLLRENIKTQKQIEFPGGCGVFVSCPRYTGSGMVVHMDDCPPDQLSVLLENGNVWYYPIEACKRTD